MHIKISSYLLFAQHKTQKSIFTCQTFVRIHKKIETSKKSNNKKNKQQKQKQQQKKKRTEEKKKKSKEK